ncbi:hypothetical protein Tco_1384114 [Tanacetum coccineum]
MKYLVKINKRHAILELKTMILEDDYYSATRLIYARFIKASNMARTTCIVDRTVMVETVVRKAGGFGMIGESRVRLFVAAVLSESLVRYLFKHIRNGSLKKNPDKRGNGGDPSRDRNIKDYNKRTRTENSFATTANSVRREYTGWWNPVNARNPTATHGACFECGGTDHFKAACPRLNQAQRPGGNHPNQAVANNEGQCDRNNGNQAGMYWLSKHKAKIIFHEKVVRIPLQNSKVFRVIGERPEEKVRQLISEKAKEQKQEEIVVVRNYPKGFSDDLSGLPPAREIKFRIELIPRVIPVAKSPSRLTPSEMDELSGQLRELQDKGFI